MKRAIALILFLVASVSTAADLTVTVPQPIVQKAQATCETLRNELRVRSSEWSNDLCATVFTRIGLRVYVARDMRQGQQQIIDAAVDAEIADFDVKWAEPFTRSYCGDNITDVEFGEECDDGDNVHGDGCSARCLNE